MAESNIPIACHDVEFAYKGRPPANCGVNLTISPGELFCLLGPNGAGKTTLISQIIGDLRPQSGSIRVFGQDPASGAGHVKARMGVIPQTVALFDNLSVKSHLKHFAAIKGIPPRARASAIAAAVEACGIGGFLDRPARALSGGQQRSVLVALALLSDPPILILDEPTVGLDPVARRMIWQTIEAQKQKGKAILLTTHHLEEAEELATHIGFISGGVLTHQGTLAQLYDLLELRVKLTTSRADGRSRESQFVATYEEAHARARNMGVADYSVGAITLEDVYFHLVDARAHLETSDA